MLENQYDVLFLSRWLKALVFINLCCPSRKALKRLRVNMVFCARTKLNNESPDFQLNTRSSQPQPKLALGLKSRNAERESVSVAARFVSAKELFLHQRPVSELAQPSQHHGQRHQRNSRRRGWTERDSGSPLHRPLTRPPTPWCGF